jgi:PKD repeat protein
MEQKTTSIKIDDKVILTMLSLAVVFLGITAFKFNTKKKCGLVDFTFRTASVSEFAYSNEDVYFSALHNNGAEKWEWDFGDKSPKDSKSGMFVTHRFKIPGQYIVKLIINGECQEPKTINVNRREDMGNKLYMNPIWPPSDTINAGQDYYFSDATKGAVTWSWYFGTDGFPRNQQSPVYNFPDPGIYKVSLVINDQIDINVVERIFTVLPPKTLTSRPVATNRPVAYTPPPMDPERSNRPINNVPVDTTPVGGVVGASITSKLGDQNKPPLISDPTLKGLLLGINGNGYNELRKYLKNTDYNKCYILFNNRILSIEQLKENIVAQQEFGDEFNVTHIVDPKYNNITQIDIKATLKKKKRPILKDKEREYPY